MPLNRLYQMSTPNFQNVFVDSNNNQLMIRTFQRLPSANVEAATRAFCLSNDFFQSFFRDEINYYERLDYGQRTLPSLNIYTQGEVQNGSFGELNGKLILEATFAIENRREGIPDNIKTICNYIMLILNGLDYFNFVESYCPGLTSSAFNQDWDYTLSLAAPDKKSQDCYIAKAECEYRISMLQYYMSLWDGETYEDAHVRVNFAS
jgi:hypothetical protein